MKIYKVEKRLGRGGFGYVDLVTMTSGPHEGEKMALKTIGARDISVGMTEQEKQAAVNEAKVLQRLKNLHVVSFYNAWWEPEDNFKILLELCEDGTLRDVLNSQKEEHIDNFKITDWSTQLALAIKYLHGRKIVHRDIKPENAFLCRGKKLLKLGDFGLFKLFETTLDYTKGGVGTPSYMAPEVHKGELCSYPADVWAFACVLFELINLKKAFTTPNKLPFAISMKVIQNKYQDFERDFCKILTLECFQDDPKTRPTISQVLEKLDQIQKELEEVQQDLDLPGISGSLEKIETSVFDLYEHADLFRWTKPLFLWINDKYFCSFAQCAEDAFFTKLTPDGHSKIEIGETHSATLRSDGRVVTGDGEGQVHLWSNGRKIKTLKVHDGRVDRMCSLNQNKIFVAPDDGTVKVLGPNFERICEMEGSKTYMQAIANLENTVATGNDDGVIYYYDLDSAPQPRILNGRSDMIWSLSLRNDLLASGSSDSTVALWKPKQMDQPAFVMKHNKKVYAVQFGFAASTNNLYSCSGDETTAIWDIETGQQLNSIKHPGWAYCLDIHKNGYLAATGHWYGVSLSDLRTPKIVKEIKGDPSGKLTQTWDLKFSPNGRRIGFTEECGRVKIVDLRY